MPYSPLAYLEVVRYQKHGKRVIDLSHPVTCLVGPSARGKSSMLRALRTLCLGKPDGPAYVRKKDPKGYLLTLGLKDKTRIQRRRGKGGCRMRLGKKVFATTGGKVPEAVQLVLGTSPVNFQSQHDAPFWLTDPPAAVGAALNALTGLDRIDAAVRLASAREREAVVKAKLLRDQHAAAEQEAKSLRWVPKAVKAKKRVDALGTKVEQLTRAAGEVAAFLKLEVPHPPPDIGPLTAAREAADAAALAEADLRQGLEELTELEDRLCDLEQELKGISSRLGKHAGKPCPVCGGRLPGRANRSSD